MTSDVWNSGPYLRLSQKCGCVKLIISNAISNPPLLITGSHNPPLLITGSHNPPLLITGSHNPPLLITGSHNPPLLITGSHNPPLLITGSHNPPLLITGSHNPPLLITGSHNPPLLITGSPTQLFCTCTTLQNERFFKIRFLYNLIPIQSVSILNSNITSFFRFVTKQAGYPFGIISLAHAPVHVTDFFIGSINCNPNNADRGHSIIRVT
jgi:hypothetical protein